MRQIRLNVTRDKHDFGESSVQIHSSALLTSTYEYQVLIVAGEVIPCSEVLCTSQKKVLFSPPSLISGFLALSIKYVVLSSALKPFV